MPPSGLWFLGEIHYAEVYPAGPGDGPENRTGGMRLASEVENRRNAVDEGSDFKSCYSNINSTVAPMALRHTFNGSRNEVKRPQRVHDEKGDMVRASGGC